MKTNAERFPGLVENFRKAIYDQLKLANPGGNYIASTSALRAAAFAASRELFDSEVDAVDTRLAINVWDAVMLTNESAFHQTMKREIDNGTLVGLTLNRGAKAIARQYTE